LIYYFSIFLVNFADIFIVFLEASPASPLLLFSANCGSFCRLSHDCLSSSLWTICSVTL